MDPIKESGYILKALVTAWGHVCDRWAFSVTWSQEKYTWTLCAEHPAFLDYGRVRVYETVTREEWVQRAQGVVGDKAEEMYLATYKPENRVFEGVR